MSVVLVIPAYNEEQQIGAVLEVGRSTKLIDEIVVVDDGSSDGTVDVAREYGAKVVELPENRGKGGAIQAGIEAARANIIMFSDADIIGLKTGHFTSLVQPLLDDPELVMTVGKFVGGRLRTDLSQTLIPAISGQRAARREWLVGLPDVSKSRFGVEVLITRHAKATGSKTMEISLSELTQVMKEEKLGLVKGVSARMRMYQDILKTFKD